MYGDLIRAPGSCKVALLRGREGVRADRRLRTDKRRIRAQSTILHKTPHRLCFYP
jgi:hypothetical protein